MIKFLKNFIKKVVLNTFSILLSILIIPVIISAIIYLINSKSKPKIVENSVLKIDLQGHVVEKPLTFFEELLAYEKDSKSKIYLWSILDSIKYAKTDNKISALYIKIEHLSIGWAQIEELKNAIEEFRKNGKLVVIYSDSYTQKSSMLATAADHIVLHPEGNFSLEGLSIVVTFYKTLLDKLEIKPEIFRVGTHKSAIEPFILSAMSTENKAQLQCLLDDIYNVFLIAMSKYTGLPVVKINEFADKLELWNPQKSLDSKFITKLGYIVDAENLLKEKLNIKTSEKINYVDTEDYASQIPKSKKKDKIAILVVEGEITTGQSTKNSIGSDTLIKTIRKIKEDESIKAVVLRINSPGGSALASDSVWKELKELSSKKPIVASMSNIAASGGYYIATACTKIVAYSTTITGSIGVFGLFFDTHLLLKNKLGIVTDVVKTNSHADMGTNAGRSLTEYEKNIIQSQVEKIYKTFIQRVADNRKLLTEEVEKIASGRVWSGSMAHRHNLIDEIGTINTAIEIATKLGGLESMNCSIVYYPYKSTNIWEELFSNAKISLFLLQNCNNEEALLASFYAKYLLDNQGIQMKMPYTLDIN